LSSASWGNLLGAWIRVLSTSSSYPDAAKAERVGMLRRGSMASRPVLKRMKVRNFLDTVIPKCLILARGICSPSWAPRGQQIPHLRFGMTVQEKTRQGEIFGMTVENENDSK